jgi:hypothetical protein
MPLDWRSLEIEEKATTYLCAAAWFIGVNQIDSSSGGFHFGRGDE